MSKYAIDFKKKYQTPIVEFYCNSPEASSRESKGSKANHSLRSENSLDEQRYKYIKSYSLLKFLPIKNYRSKFYNKVVYFLKTQVAAVMGVKSGKPQAKILMNVHKYIANA